MPAPARGFKVLEDKENAVEEKAVVPAERKGLSSRSQDAVLSTFNAQQNIPRVFQLQDGAIALDKVRGERDRIVSDSLIAFFYVSIKCEIWLCSEWLVILPFCG